MEEKKTKRKLKKPVVYGICLSLLLVTLSIFYYVDFQESKLADAKDKKQEQDYVTRVFGDDSIPTVSQTNTIIRPYTDENVGVLQNFYSKDATEEEQEKSINNYEQTYIQNRGTAYGGVDGGFDVISVLDGTVTSVKQDNLLGTTIEIKNSDKITTIYQSLSTTNVKENDTVTQGQIIGKSGTSNLNKDLNDHLLFKLKINNSYVNPEDYYNKNISEIK